MGDWTNVINSVGLPTAILVFMGVALSKIGKEAVAYLKDRDLKQQEFERQQYEDDKLLQQQLHAEQKKDFSERQEMYRRQQESQNEMFEIMVRAMEQATASQNATASVIERNNVLIDKNNRTYEKLEESFVRVSQEMRDAVKVWRDHDKNANEIRHIVERCVKNI